jgi:hypothetical protein
MISRLRPLHLLSDFVAQKLPGFSALEISRAVESILVKVTPEQIESAVQINLELTLLDLKMCVAAIENSPNGSAELVPSRLRGLVNQLCGTIYVPVLQYHELIEVNPGRYPKN